MSDNKVKGARRLNSANTQTNAISFLVDQSIKATVNTAEVVSVGKADQSGTGGPAGYASATPLVCQTDAFDNTLAPATIAKLPFFRPQAGKAAIVMDPQPGDKAIAVFMKRDSTGVQSGKNEPVQPSSHRTFDQADGWMINGFLGETPEIWLMLDPVFTDDAYFVQEHGIPHFAVELGRRVPHAPKGGDKGSVTDGDFGRTQTGEHQFPMACKLMKLLQDGKGLSRKGVQGVHDAFSCVPPGCTRVFPQN